MANSVFGAAGTTIFETMSRLAAETGSINLGQGFPEGLEPRAVIEKAAEALLAGPHQYPSMMGIPALRQAVAANAKRFMGLDVDWEREVMVTSGATEALCDAILGLFDPGDEVLIFEPVYDSYAPILKRGGMVPVPIRLRPPGWELPREEIRAALGPRTRGLIVNTPMNPIGKVFSESELGFLADMMLAFDLVAICDEVYEHLVFEGHTHRSLFAMPEVRDRVVRIGSAGKTFSVTAWKIGYITADPKLLQPIARAHQYITFTTPPALQAAVAFGLTMDDAYYTGLKTDLAARRDLLSAGLTRVGFEVLEAPATYFSVVGTGDLDPLKDDLAFCQRLTREAGVTAIPISSFYGNRDVTGYIRFCFAKTDETLCEAIRRLEAWRDGAAE